MGGEKNPGADEEARETKGGEFGNCDGCRGEELG